jgi:hypothetical protein
MSDGDQSDQAAAPPRVLSSCALSLRAWGMTSYKATIILAMLWMLMILGSALSSPSQSAFDRVLGVFILGVLPCAIAYLFAWVSRIVLVALSLAFDPVETMLVVLGSLAVALILELRARLRDGWLMVVSAGRPRLRQLATTAHGSLRPAGDAAFRLATAPIRCSARLLLSISSAPMRESAAR